MENLESMNLQEKITYLRNNRLMPHLEESLENEVKELIIEKAEVEERIENLKKTINGNLAPETKEIDPLLLKVMNQYNTVLKDKLNIVLNIIGNVAEKVVEFFEENSKEEIEKQN